MVSPLVLQWISFVVKFLCALRTIYHIVHCDQFITFSQQYGFTHIMSSPKYPEANGEDERAVTTIKELLKRNQYQNGDMYFALLAYRSTQSHMVIAHLHF